MFSFITGKILGVFMNFFCVVHTILSMSEGTEKIGLESLVKRRKDFEMNTLIKILQN